MTESIIRFKDKMKYKPDGFGLKGRIKISDADTGKTLVDKDNHIVITGRHWLMQRMFNMPFVEGTDEYTWLPGWFAVGTGGTVQDSPFTPIWPADEDTDLYNPEPFTATGSQYSIDGKHKIVDSITMSEELITVLSMTLDYNDVAESYINEAAMYVGKATTYTNTDFLMFSHVTFPSFPKSQYQKLTIEWYFTF